MAQEREDLIYSLARSMGMGESQKAKSSSGKYNAETGTIYSNGHMISKAAIEQAKVYFTAQYRKMAEIDDENTRQMAMLYEVAMEAIGMMLEGSSGNTGSGTPTG
ncbi:MAG: hypothetical protein E7307_06240 [Butyrivibrio sp.]|nr:hypothetical protein [Butyrivibrio sp.]